MRFTSITDMLVYIPYFVLGEIEPDNQTAIDSMKHFIWIPGVIYADKVIVQSEKMKQIYVNEYLKAAKESGFKGEHIDRRLSGNLAADSLIPSMIRAMRPQLWAEYSKIVEKYRQEGWEIFDDSVDMDRAVVISDADYADASSVVQFCRKREMPDKVKGMKFETQRQIILFGVGKTGTQFYKTLLRYGIFAGFADNDIDKQNNGCEGYTVYSSNVLKDMEAMIVASVGREYSNEVKHQLENVGMAEGINFITAEEFEKMVLGIVLVLFWQAVYKFGADMCCGKMYIAVQKMCACVSFG